MDLIETVRIITIFSDEWHTCTECNTTFKSWDSAINHQLDSHRLWLTRIMPEHGRLAAILTSDLPAPKKAHLQ